MDDEQRIWLINKFAFCHFAHLFFIKKRQKNAENANMESPEGFSKKVINAINLRAQWYDATVMPKILGNYRLIHTCVKNLYELMLKKSILKPDPYRLDKKIFEIKSPENSQFAESDRINVFGLRFSDYETMLDWICTYYKFSTEKITIGEIKKLMDFNNSFQWTSLTPNNTHPNTRALSQTIAEIRHSADSFTSSTLNDILSKCQMATNELFSLLKDLSDFAKEQYKANIRNKIFFHPKFNMQKAFSSAHEEMSQIKKLFPTVFGKVPFYTQLVDEIIKEDQGSECAKKQEALLKKIAVPKEEKKKKKKAIDPHEYLMITAQSLCAFSTPLKTICAKLNENNNLILEAANTGFAKFLHSLRKALNIEERPVTYEVAIFEQTTSGAKKQKIEFKPFLSELQKRALFYNSFATKNSAGYKKILDAEAQKTVDFLTKQILEMQNLNATLKGLDNYFKNCTEKEVRPKIKGITMELTMLKNNIINTRQYLSDYISYVEEQEQMRKLGISDE